MIDYLFGILIIIIGAMITGVGVYGIKHCFSLSCKTEAKFIKLERVTNLYRNPHYYLWFSYMVDGKEKRTRGDDFYSEFRVRGLKIKYIPNHTYTIYYDPKDPRDFQTKRFRGLFTGLLMLFLGMSFIIIALRECF